MGESKGKIFRCDAGGCNALKVTETGYKKPAPAGWHVRQGPGGRLMACSEECTVKVDKAVAPLWKAVS